MSRHSEVGYTVLKRPFYHFVLSDKMQPFSRGAMSPPRQPLFIPAAVLYGRTGGRKTLLGEASRACQAPSLWAMLPQLYINTDTAGDNDQNIAAKSWLAFQGMLELSWSLERTTGLDGKCVRPTETPQGCKISGTPIRNDVLHQQMQVQTTFSMQNRLWVCFYCLSLLSHNREVTWPVKLHGSAVATVLQTTCQTDKEPWAKG